MKRPRVLVGCEASGRVRDAFIAAGCDAVSCDIVPTDAPGPHIQGDVIPLLTQGWDLMIAFPPCTYLSTAGARYWPKRQKEQAEALDFVTTLMNAPISRIAIENPVGCISTRIRKPDQKVNPWWFGDPFEKLTCLWLKNLPLLVSTNVVTPPPRDVFHDGRTMASWYNLPPGPNRAKIRSMTFQGFADAMAAQWAPLLFQEAA